MIPVEKISTLFIGHTGENMAETFEFDFSEWSKRYGKGEIILALKRPIDDVPYPVNLEINGDVATWLVSDIDVAVEGYGIAELVYKVGSVVKKSAKFKLYIENSLADATGVPESGQTWLDAVTQKVLEGQQYAADAKNAQIQTNLDAVTTGADRIVVEELAKAVDADAKEVMSNKATVIESKKAVDLAEQRINTAVEDVGLMQLDVQTNKKAVDRAKAEVDKKATEVANNAKDVGINATVTAENAKTAESAKNDAVTASNMATEAAKQAEFSVNKGGYVYFNIKNGHLFFTRTETSEFDFKLEEGRLIAYAK